MGLMAAIFLIMVVTVLSVAVVRSVRSGAGAFAQDILFQRAFLAAESGAQLGLNRVFAPAGSGTCVDQTFALDALDLPDCDADVRCRSETVEGRVTYTVESRGRCSAGTALAERHVLVRAAD